MSRRARPVPPRRRRPPGQGLRAALLIGGATALTGCAGLQSALDPMGPSAREVATLWWIMFWAAWAILGLVMVLALYAVLRSPERRRPIAGVKFIVWLGAVFPTVVLGALLVYSTLLNRALLPEAANPAPLTVEVIGKMWWWDVRYPDAGAGQALVTANEIRIPVGRPVRFAVTTTDVIHSFWVPNLGGKIDMIPGHINFVTLQADTPGIYRGQCAEFCGAQHARMAFYVVAMPPDEFEAWLDKERRPAVEPTDEFAARGRRAFIDNGCGACHTVRGTEARGTLGPDLTHMGGRLSIAAGTLPNNRGTLAGWIADAQGLKPGNRMPSFNRLDAVTLREIAAYLEGLR